jgi:urease accessory protein
LLALRETNDSPILGRFAALVEEGRVSGHHTVVFGLGLAQMPELALLASWAFQSLSAVCLSAPKLLRLGQNAAQRILTTALAHLDDRIVDSLTIERDQIGWFDPTMEIASMQHEIAYERLFIS